MKKKLTMMLAAVVAMAGFAENVTNVRGMQREKSNLVDIYYDIEATDGGTYSVAVQVEGRTNTVTAATFTGDVGEGVAPGRNRHILWNAGADWPNKKGDVRAIVTATKQDGKHGKVQLWEGGPYWADRNVGASRPEDYGLYFWWGDTVGHRPSADGKFSFNFYYSNSAIYTYGKSVSELQSSGWVTSDSVLAPKHDAAHVKWGGAWRIPTIEELSGLHNNCVWTWTTMNDVKGLFIRGKGAYSSNSIFLPAVGYGDGASRSGYGFGTYWSSEPCIYYDSDRDTSGDLQFGDGYVFYFTTGRRNRWYGYSVRPVQ